MVDDMRARAGHPSANIDDNLINVAKYNIDADDYAVKLS